MGLGFLKNRRVWERTTAVGEVNIYDTEDREAAV